MSMPLPPGALPVPQKDGSLTENESTFILDSTLKSKHRSDPTVLAFIDEFVRTKNIAQASDHAGVKYSLGYMYRHRADIAACIQKIIDKSVIKYGFDASEIMERTKEIVDFDPIQLQNADGTFKDNLHDIDPAARRNIKKFKAKNIWSEDEDLNGMKRKIIIGKLIEVEFYDKLKAVELVGKEKEMFKTTTKVEHTVTKDMASLLLASAERGQQASIAHSVPRTIESESYVVKEDESDTDT